LGKGLGFDVRAAWRALRASSTLTTAAALTLALSVGATTALFSVANGLMLRPLPVTDPDRLVTISSETALRFGFQAGGGWSYEMWDRLRGRLDAFDGGFAWMLQRLELSDAGAPQPVETLFASGDFFTTLGVRAIAGRTFTAADDVPGGGPAGAVAVISHDLWQRRFNGAPSAVGARLLVDGTPVTVIGVAPRGFRGVDVGRPFDVALPLGAELLIRGPRAVVATRSALLLTVMLRLKDGQAMTAATAALRAMQPEIIGTDVPQNLKEPIVLVSASTGISDRSRLRQVYERPLVVLLIVSGLVLLVVCVNIANLFVVRAAARRRELRVRLAVGAPPWRLARQLFVEGLSLGAASAAAGMVLAIWASRALISRLPSTGQVLVDLPLDWRVLGFISAVTIAAVVLFATAPAVYAARVPSIEALQQDRAGAGRGTGSLTAALIVAQVALSLVLLAAAGVFGRTLNRLAHVPLGFDPNGLTVMTVNAPRSQATAAERIRFYERVIDAVGGTPGVQLAAGSTWIPFGDGGGGLLRDARNRRVDIGRQASFNFVTPGWFATYRTALRAGRDFDGRDSAASPHVAIVNETLRRNALGGGDPIGATIQSGPCGARGCVVVGVVEDALYGRSLRDQPPPTVYVPFAQSAGLGPPNASLRVSVRTNGDPARLASTLTAAVHAIDPSLTMTFRSLDRDVRASLAQERLVATLAGFFGVLALLLSAIGLYGVTAFAVARRRREVAIRVALGGRPHRIMRELVGRIGALVALGIAIGVLGASWLARFVAPLIYGLEPRDPGTLAASGAVLVGIAAIATLLPAWRSARAEPADILRRP
jgi:predicted permease